MALLYYLCYMLLNHSSNLHVCHNVTVALNNVFSFSYFVLGEALSTTPMSLSPHTLPDLYFVFPQNLQWARDVLLGSSVPWQQLKHMPAQGLFCERNKTNLFNVSDIITYI